MKTMGFLVVRLPSLNFDVLQRGAYSGEVPCRENIYYGGVERMPWFDIDEAFYEKTLPNNLSIIRHEIMSGANFGGISLCRDLQSAIKLLEYSNSNKFQNELITVYADELIEIAPPIDIHGKEVRRLGYDLAIWNEWSILREGCFSAKGHFNEFFQKINANGLLDSQAECQHYETQYRVLETQGHVEEPAPNYRIIYLDIWKIL